MSKRKTPTLRFKGFNNDWEQRKFSKLYFKSKEKNDLSFSKNQKISLATMKWSKISDNSSKKYMKSYNVFRMGDIAFEGNKSKNFQFGRFVENDLGNGIVSHVFDVYRPINKSKHDIRFWKYYIHNEKVMRNILRKSTTSATMMHNLVNKDILRQKLIIPNFKEMKSIGSILEKMDLNVDLQKRKYKELELLKKALLQKLFLKGEKSTPQLKFKNLSRVWKKGKIGNLLAYEQPNKYIVKSSTYVKNGIPVLTANKSFILGYTKENNFYNKGDCIIFDDFTLENKFVSFPFKVKSSAIKILTPKNNKTSLYFMYYLLNTTKFIKEGHARHYISIVQNKNVNIPAINVQKKIGNFFKKCDYLIIIQNKKCEKLKSIKKFLLQNIFI